MFKNYSVIKFVKQYCNSCQKISKIHEWLFHKNDLTQKLSQGGIIKVFKINSKLENIWVCEYVFI